MRLHIVRHADPDYKKGSITQCGHKEARALAKKIKKEGIDKLFCSPINRAIETANYTAKATGANIVIKTWLQEVNWEKYIKGDYKCPFDLPGEKLLSEPNRPSYSNWMKNKNFNAKAIMFDLSPKLKELDKLLCKLGYKREGFHYVELKKNKENVYLFCHAGIGTSIISYLLNIPLPIVWLNFWLAPTSITTILFSKRNGNLVMPRCIHLNDVSHLYESNLPVKPRGLKGEFY